MTPQPGTQSLVVHTLSNISKSKGNQTLKSGQLIEYKMKHNSWKIMSNCGGETFPRPFSKKIKIEYISESIVYSLYSLFLLYVKLRAIEVYWN